MKSTTIGYLHFISIDNGISYISYITHIIYPVELFIRYYVFPLEVVLTILVERLQFCFQKVKQLVFILFIRLLLQFYLGL